MASNSEPPYLPIGTDVSAKYRGAFCEAKVKKIVKSVKCRVFLKETQSSLLITDEFITGSLQMGATVEVKHPDTGRVMEAIIKQMSDSSMYTVVFDDADERTLRRTQLCLKGDKHFMESETLDNLPLSNPEHFGTPVIARGKRGRTSIGTGSSHEESESSSSEDESPRKKYRGKNQELVGKVMFYENGDRKKSQTLPVLVVLPDAHDTELKNKDHVLIRSFKDGKYLSVARKDLNIFARETILKSEDKALKPAMEKALLYVDNRELPATWKKEEMLGSDDDEEEEEDDMSDDDEISEEKDRFVAQLYKFSDDRGTPINKGPSIGTKDLNLYKLFKVVQKYGGYNRVTNQMKWRLVYSKMQLPPSNTASTQIKNAYKKYLHAFEDFYRKLGSSMGTISRPSRSRNDSGRSILNFRGRESARTPDKIEDLVKQLEDFDRYFNGKPDIYDQYLNLLFKGEIVIEALIAEGANERKDKTLKEDISLDIGTLKKPSSVLKDKNVKEELINTILTLRKSHAEAALISHDTDAFIDKYFNSLKYSIDLYMSRYEKIDEKCKTSTKDSDSYQTYSDSYQTYLDGIRKKGVHIQSIEELYKETKQKLETLLKEVIVHKISPQNDEITLTLCVLNMKLNSTLEKVLARGFQDRIKSHDLDTLTEVVCDFLTETKNAHGVKDVKFKLVCKTDWKTCVRSSNEKMALELLSKPDDLPDKETLNEVCAVFGRKSNITFKVCKKVCCFIKESSPHIIDVYPSRKAEDLKEGEEIEIKFVVITENLDEESRKKLEKDIRIQSQGNYDTLPIRDRYQLSGEETELHKDGRHELKDEDLNRIKTCMRQNAESLLKRHTYLTIISGSPIKSVGYGTSNHRIVESPCIVLNVPYKGYIPIDEEPFQKEYDGVVTDVREDLFVLFTNTASARHNFLKNGCQISGNFSTGTLGGFVVHPDYGPCGISCCHVLLSPAELNLLSENDEINWERPSLLARKNDKTCEGNVFQPDASDKVNNLIGKLVKVCYRRGRPDSLEMDAYGMDVALFQLNQRLPVSSEFPVVQVATDDISSAGNDNNSPVYKEVPRQFGKGAVAGFAWLEGEDYSKFGATTGYTTGEMSVNCGTSVKVPLDWTYEDGPNKFRFILHNQVSIIKSNTTTDDILPFKKPDGNTDDSTGWFGYHGDSGALVYQKTTDGNLVCVGMVVGGLLEKKLCIVTPILPVLKEMGITSFKDFDSEQLEVNMRTLVQDMGHVKQRMGKDQERMERMETRINSIETTMNTGFASVIEKLNQLMQNP